MIKIRLVRDNMGADYTNDYLHYYEKELSHFIVNTNRTAFSGTVYPSTVDIFLKGFPNKYTVLASDFNFPKSEGEE